VFLLGAIHSCDLQYHQLHIVADEKPGQQGPGSWDHDICTLHKRYRFHHIHEVQAALTPCEPQTAMFGMSYEVRTITSETPMACDNGFHLRSSFRLDSGSSSVSMCSHEAFERCFSHLISAPQFKPGTAKCAPLPLRHASSCCCSA
jgi:hypothetical protein